MKLLKKMTLLLAAVMLVITAITGCGGNSGDTGGKKSIIIGTGGTAGTYYPVGGAIAEVLNKDMQNMTASVQSTGGSIANINMLDQGVAQLAFVQNDIAYYAANGLEMFKEKKINNLKAIAALYPETCQVITLEKSGITSISQLKGKKVAVGAMGSGVEANARQIMEAYGITYDDISVQYLSFSEATNALKEGTVDVAFITAGHPTAAVQSLAAEQKVRLLPVDADKAKALIAQYPYYTQVTVPAGTYGLAQEISTVSVMAIIVCSNKVDDLMGYDITKAIFNNLDQIKDAHAVGKYINKERAIQGMPIPMNAGAEKFLKE